MSEQDHMWLRNWMASVSVVMALQIGTLIWFLASQATEQNRMSKVLERMEPEHNEVYFFYTQRLKNK
jgi:hypothetical protein